jgi:fatty acyl-CoA reductase
MQPTGGKSIWHAPTYGGNILDEIPVDLVANVLLQHVHLGTRGVVHASASYYIPKTLKWILEQLFEYLPAHWTERMAKLVFVQDQTVEESKEAKFYRIGSRAWEFCAPSSQRLRTLSAPWDLA